MTPKREYCYTEKYLHTNIKKTLRTYDRNCLPGETYSYTHSHAVSDQIFRAQPQPTRTNTTKYKKDATQTVRNTRGTAPQWSIFCLVSMKSWKSICHETFPYFPYQNNRGFFTVFHENLGNFRRLRRQFFCFPSKILEISKILSWKSSLTK